MARRRLADVLGTDEAWPSVSVVDARGVIPEVRHREAEKRWEERIMRESGKMSVSYDPSLFEWVSSRVVAVTTPAVVLKEKAILIRGVPEIEPWLRKAVEIGFAPRSLAFRLSQSGCGWKLFREANTRSARFRMVMPSGVRAELQRRGWPFGVALPAAWDEKNRMVVVSMPKGDERRGAVEK